MGNLGTQDVTNQIIGVKDNVFSGSDGDQTKVFLSPLVASSLEATFCFSREERAVCSLMHTIYNFQMPFRLLGT